MWIKLDDGFLDHPKVHALGDKRSAAIHLWIGGLSYSTRYLTDGDIPGTMLFRLTLLELEDARAAAAALVESGLWEKTGEGWRIHDYLDFNFSREVVLERRAMGRVRGKAAANSRWHPDPAAHPPMQADGDADEDPRQDADEDALGGSGSAHAPYPLPAPVSDPRSATAHPTEDVARLYRQLYGRVPSERMAPYLASIEEQWGPERTCAALRGEHRRDSDPSTIGGRMKAALARRDKETRSKERWEFDDATGTAWRAGDETHADGPPDSAAQGGSVGAGA